MIFDYVISLLPIFIIRIVGILPGLVETWRKCTGVCDDCHVGAE